MSPDRQTDKQTYIRTPYARRRLYRQMRLRTGAERSGHAAGGTLKVRLRSGDRSRPDVTLIECAPRETRFKRKRKHAAIHETGASQPEHGTQFTHYTLANSPEHGTQFTHYTLANSPEHGTTY